MTETYLKTLVRHLMSEDRAAALRLCNRVLKKRAILANMGKHRFWEQMQFELKKPDPDFAEWEFVRIIRNEQLSEHDYTYILETYRSKATVLSVPYYDAVYHYRLMVLAKEMKRND